jgi:hypothetical protein
MLGYTQVDELLRDETHKKKADDKGEIYIPQRGESFRRK